VNTWLESWPAGDARALPLEEITGRAQPRRSAERLSARAVEYSGAERDGRSAVGLGDAPEAGVHPRRPASRQAEGYALPSWDPRLSMAAIGISKQLGALLDGLSRIENWLRHRGRAELTACDTSVMRPALEKLGGHALEFACLTTRQVRENHSLIPTDRLGELLWFTKPRNQV
jgi:hypothetical protein